MRILIVEDSDSVSKMIEALVKGRGHEVETAASGPRALELAFTTAPELILLDLHLAGSYDGFEVCRRLRADTRTLAVPIVVISALDDSESKQRALESGASAYYTKPFSPMALLKEIEGFQTRAG
ncbi:MAG TPA: response regulator [Polyangiaceae bacterium]|nr:response regulator [Polyangiaceae bacterium]